MLKYPGIKEKYNVCRQFRSCLQTILIYLKKSRQNCMQISHLTLLLHFRISARLIGGVTSLLSYDTILRYNFPFG